MVANWQQVGWGSRPLGGGGEGEGEGEALLFLPDRQAPQTGPETGGVRLEELAAGGEPGEQAGPYLLPLCLSAH